MIGGAPPEFLIALATTPAITDHDLRVMLAMQGVALHGVIHAEEPEDRAPLTRASMLGLLGIDNAGFQAAVNRLVEAGVFVVLAASTGPLDPPTIALNPAFGQRADDHPAPAGAVRH